MIATELGELEAFRSLIGGWNQGRVTVIRAGFDPAYVRENYLSSAEADTSGTQA